MEKVGGTKKGGQKNTRKAGRYLFWEERSTFREIAQKRPPTGKSEGGSAVIVVYPQMREGHPRGWWRMKVGKKKKKEDGATWGKKGGGPYATDRNTGGREKKQRDAHPSPNKTSKKGGRRRIFQEKKGGSASRSQSTLRG